MRNKFGLGEWSGAFGDLGTLIPFVVGYIAVVGINPTGILVTFGIFSIITGIRFKTPMPVQPMKAIAATSIAGAVTPNMIGVAGLFSGLFWLVIGLTGALKWVKKIVGKPLIRGITLGLGFSFMFQGLGFMQEGAIVAILAAILAFAMVNSKRIPTMLVLLAFGIIASSITNPYFMQEISTISIGFSLPTFALGGLTWQEVATGIFILAIPQIPLSLGNSILSTTDQHNQLFPERPIAEKDGAISMGIANLTAPIIGGVPMCHGSGGLAAHTRFGGRTGGTMIIIGSILLLLGLFFGSSVLTIFYIIPVPVLGVILFMAGLELAMSARDIGSDKQDFYIMLITAGFSLWNVGIGFVAGLIAQQVVKFRNTSG
ncbi:MAG: putative sulfate/molybdate transporter [Defluviitaleaceae bacterium]|nr:putative sulfate/molybdate transporter [Defluviitaleaceae bacterium]